MFASSKYLSPCPRAIVGGDFLSLERTKKYLGEARVRSSASASNPGFLFWILCEGSRLTRDT